MVRLRVPAENRSDEQDIYIVQVAYISEDTGTDQYRHGITDHH